jgi:hypothetical protein
MTNSRLLVAVAEPPGDGEDHLQAGERGGTLGDEERLLA